MLTIITNGQRLQELCLENQKLDCSHMGTRIIDEHDRERKIVPQKDIIDWERVG